MVFCECTPCSSESDICVLCIAANSGKESQTSCPENCQNPIPETPKEHSSEKEQTLTKKDEQKGEKMEVDEKAESDELSKIEASEKMDTSTPDFTSPSEEKGIDIQTFPVCQFTLFSLLFCGFVVEEYIEIIYFVTYHSC